MLYPYLLKKYLDCVPYSVQQASVWTRLCVRTFHTLYGDRYWREVAMRQLEEAQRLHKAAQAEIKQYEKKLDIALRLYAAHIGVPPERRMNGQAEPDEMDEPIPMDPTDPYLGMPDEVFAAGGSK